MDPLQRLALCLAALCSHINHPGLSATALEELEHPMATRYAALAAAGIHRDFAAAPTVIQCHHCAVAVAFLGAKKHAAYTCKGKVSWEAKNNEQSLNASSCLMTVGIGSACWMASSLEAGKLDTSSYNTEHTFQQDASGSPSHNVLHSMPQPEACALREASHALCTILCSTDARQHFHVLAAAAHAIPSNHQGLQSLHTSPKFSLSFSCQVGVPRQGLNDILATCRGFGNPCGFMGKLFCDGSSGLKFDQTKSVTDNFIAQYKRNICFDDHQLMICAAALLFGQCHLFKAANNFQDNVGLFLPNPSLEGW
eukprot:1152455-Pelagomonas_calceolata.AAC.4